MLLLSVFKHYFFFASLIITPLSSTNYNTKAGSIPIGISNPEHNIKFDFSGLLKFYS